MTRPETTFQWAMQRLANFERGQVLPIVHKTATEGTDGKTKIRKIEGYVLQWIERIGPDISDCIICSYKVTAPEDLKLLKQALERKAKTEQRAKEEILARSRLN
jgi:hypothetical protein